MKGEMVSVIIASFKKAEEIDWLKNIDRQTYDNYEIIVDGSKGVSNARNNALKKAMGSIIAFADDDIIMPEKNWLENIVKNMKDEYGIAGKIVPTENNTLNKIPEHYDQGDEPHYTIFGASCNLAFKKEIFDEVGYFDERLKGNEESELINRFIKKYKLKYCPDVIVYHNYAKSLSQYFRKRWHSGKNDLYYWKMTGRYPFSSYMTERKEMGKKQKVSLSDRVKINIVKKVGWIFEGIGILQSVVK